MKTLIKTLAVMVILLYLMGIAFIIGMSIETPLEVQRGEMDRIDPACICDCGDVYVDCCCPTEAVSHTPTATPFEPTTPTASATTTRNTPTSVSTPTQRPTRTVSPTVKSSTPTATVTPQPPTSTVPVIPTKTVVVGCFQWLCHKPGTPAEQDYCCESQGCVDAHLKHGDYLGRCLNEQAIEDNYSWFVCDNGAISHIRYGVVGLASDYRCNVVGHGNYYEGAVSD